MLFKVAVAASILIPWTALAQTSLGPVKPVEVVNGTGAPVPFEMISDVQPRFQLVGFTDALTTAGGISRGLFALTDACQSEFDSETRACTTEEVLDTVDIPDEVRALRDYDWAWVRPSIRGYTDAIRPLAVDASGIAASPEGLSCLAFESASGQGLVVSPRGIVNTSDCALRRRVACCGLTQSLSRTEGSDSPAPDASRPAAQRQHHRFEGRGPEGGVAAALLDCDSPRGRPRLPRPSGAQHRQLGAAFPYR